jgi:hypothetical protein
LLQAAATTLGHLIPMVCQSNEYLIVGRGGIEPRHFHARSRLLQAILTAPLDVILGHKEFFRLTFHVYSEWL